MFSNILYGGYRQDLHQGFSVEPKNIWGPKAWYSLHLQAIKFPLYPTDQQRVQTVHWVLDFIGKIPCHECRMHARQYLENHPLGLGCSETFQLWVYKLHNDVNRRLGKPVISYKEYQNEYEQEINKAHLSYK